MGFQHGTTARFYWHTMDWSPYVESVDMSLTRGLAEHRPLAGTAVVRVPGHRDMSLILAGTPYEALTTDEVGDDRFRDGVGRPFAYLPDGDVVGALAYCGLSRVGDRSGTAGDDIVRLPMGLVSAGEFDRALVLHRLTNAGLSPGASVDGSAPSANGGVAYLLVTATDGGDLDVVVEDSDDNATWLPLVTMTTATAKGSEVKTVSGAVERYLRVSWTLSSGSASWFLAFGRR